MKKLVLFSIVGVSVAALLSQLSGNQQAKAQIGSRTMIRTQYQNRSGGKGQSSYETRLWDWLQGVKYKNWAPVPGKTGDAYPGESPHGAFLKMYLNRTAAGDLKKLPSGSILIKENYGKDKKTLMAVTVMFRSKGYDPEHNDWYWVKYMPNGTVAKAPPEKGSMRLAGKVKGCIMCHEGADGKDFAFVNDE